MSGLREVMAAAVANQKPALIIYLTQGDPSCEATVDIIEAAVSAGADVVELGVPFSDPSADGIVIQQAMQRALAAGGGLRPALEAVSELRRRGCDVPIVLFGYYNPIFVFGVEAFAKAAKQAGIDAVLTVDLPIDELDELRLPLAGQGVGVIPLVAPTSTEARIAAVKEVDAPFVYYISMTGVTGAAFKGTAGGTDRIAAVRKATSAPVAVGFGIKTGDDARQVAALADGVVVGSALVSRIAAAADAAAAAASVAELVSELRAAIDSGEPSV